MFQELEKLHHLCFPHKPWSANDFADLKKSGCEIIASANGFIVWRAIADEAEIITVGVHPDLRGNGIAEAMLVLLDSELRKNNVKRIVLEVAENNAPAIALYKKHGYQSIARRPKYYDGIDALLMEKFL